ncbi:hypothetical protein ACFLZZ_03330 [Nanoarchaeota archaeon]
MKTQPKLKTYQKKVSSFINSITPKDKIALFHDIDGDGLFATGLLIKALQRLNLKPILLIGIGREEISPSKNTIKRLKNAGITKLFILDKPSDIDLEAIKQIEKFSDILIIDHHKIFGKAPSKRTTIIKPQFFTKIPPSGYPTAKMIYTLFSKLVDLTDLDWMAAAGTMSDTASGDWIVRDVVKKYGFKDKDPWDTPLGKLENYISLSALHKSGDHNTSLKILIESNTYEDVLNSKLKKPYIAVYGEIQKHIKKFKRISEFKDDLVFCSIKPKYKINTPFLTIMSVKYYPNHTLVLITDFPPNKSRISFRRNDFKKDTSNIAREAIKGFKQAQGGGHAPASGAIILKKDLEEFKRRVEKLNKEA